MCTIAAVRSIRKKITGICKQLVPKGVVRAKGILWFSDKDKRDYLYVFEQAGVQITATENGKWLAAFPKSEQKKYFKEYPDIEEHWDEKNTATVKSNLYLSVSIWISRILLKDLTIVLTINKEIITGLIQKNRINPVFLSKKL